MSRMTTDTPMANEITFTQAARRAGLTVNSIRQAARYGHFTHRRTGPLNTMVIPLHEFEAWLERRQQRQAPAC